MLNRWQRTIVDLRGNVVPYAQLQIRVESTQATATIYADRAGNELIPNGIVTADANGYAFFYAEADLYRISSMQPTIDWRYVDIGGAGALQRGSNLSDVADPATARGNLGLGSAAGADVVQGTGNSEDDVMSQKAATNAFPKLSGGDLADFQAMIKVAGKNVVASGANANGFWMELSVGILLQVSAGFRVEFQSDDLLLGQWSFPRQASGDFAIITSASDLTTSGLNSSRFSPSAVNAYTNNGAQIVVRSQGGASVFTQGEQLGVTCFFIGVV